MTDDLAAESFCPDHGGPVDDCEMCRDEQGRADRQATDEDWNPDD